MEVPQDSHMKNEQKIRDRAAVRKHRKVTWIILGIGILIVVGFFCGLFALSGRQNTVAEDTAQEEYSDGTVTDLVIEETDSDDISVIMVGDMLLHTDILKSGLMEDGSYNYDHIFAHTADVISDADIAIVNEEVILGGSELGLSGYPSFNAGFEVGDALVNAGFNVICHATNHALDQGKMGLLNCLDFWRTSYPDTEVLGIHDSQEDADQIHLLSVKGCTIAILNYTGIMNGSPDIGYSVDMLDRDKVCRDLEQAREQADFVIVVPHWGTEYSFGISEYQKEWAQVFLENGVDLVIGAHPHVIEPVEWLEDDEGHRMLVYYSLGNFISFTEGSGEGKGERAVGAMAQVTLHVEDGEVSISEYGVKPVVAHLVAGRGNPTVYFLEDYTQELADESEMSTKDPTFSLKSCQDLCRQVFKDLYQEN